MARCFPFDRVEYLRLRSLKEEGEPLIESIKFQKETEKAKENRKERKEKKKEKKEKKEKKHRIEKSRPQEGNSKQEEHTHKKRKHRDRDNSGVQDDCCTKPIRDVIEHLEKSSLTEENGLPCTSLNPYDSSDSTQDSSKRRKLNPSVLVHSGSGLTLRIKPPLQKNADADRPATSVQPQSNVCGTSQMQLPLKNRPQLVQERRDLVPPVSKKQPSISGRVAEMSPLQKNTCAAFGVQHPSSVSGRTLDEKQLLLKSRTLPESRDLGPTVSNKRLCVPGKVAVAPQPQKTNTESTAIGVQFQPSILGRTVGEKQVMQKFKPPFVQESKDLRSALSDSGKAVVSPMQKSTNVERPMTQSSISGRTSKEELLLKGKSPLVQESRDLRGPASNQLQHTSVPLPPAVDGQPCFSGRVAEGEAAVAARRHSRHRSSSRTKDIIKQYNDLIVNWTPPPLQLEFLDGGDHDWLFAANHSGAKRCSASTSASMEHGSSVLNPIQPRALYLSEHDMYALPYVIPF